VLQRGTPTLQQTATHCVFVSHVACWLTVFESYRIYIHVYMCMCLSVTSHVGSLSPLYTCIHVYVFISPYKTRVVHKHESHITFTNTYHTKIAQHRHHCRIYIHVYMCMFLSVTKSDMILVYMCNGTDKHVHMYTCI